MKQKKIAHILCHTLQKVGPKIEIYPAEQWNKTEAKEGLYRLRIDRKWYCSNGRKYTFLTPEELGQVIVAHIGINAPEAEAKPIFKHGQRVSVRGPNSWTMGIIGSTPIQGPDGHWRVWVSGYGIKKFYFCEDIRRWP